MLDLIITTICMIIIFFFPFFLFKYMKIFNLLLLFINYILIMVLIFNNKDYRKLDAWKYPEEFHPIQKTIFLPIKSIKGIYDSNSNLINLDFMKTDGIFSIVKSDEYSKECLHNYYIKETSECPMTDIILEKTQVNTHDNYVEQKISDDMYLYYTKESKLDGKLYEDISIYSVGSGSACSENNNFKINNKCSQILFKSNFDYKNVSAIIDSEEEKKSNPFKDFKNFVNYCDKICVLLIVLSFICTLYEPSGHKIINYYKIISWNCHSYILILLSIRYNKYRKIKQYLIKYKDIYKDNLPYAVFNLDTTILSISISVFVFYILYLIIPSKCHCTKINDNQNNDNYENEKYMEYLKERKKRICALIIPLYIIFFYIILYEVMNDFVIKENYKIINYNWELNSITSISISNNPEFGYSNIEKGWKNIFIEYKTNEYNYYNISTNNKDDLKICGKDSQDNDLYFPKDVECPVNDIFISKFDSNEYDGYTKLKLSDEAGYLYYTNKKTRGKVVTSIIVGTNDPLKIYSGSNYLRDDDDRNNYNDYFENNENKDKKKIDRFNTVFFYEEIDSWNECENQDSCSDKDMHKLYAINYLGVNKNLIGKINDFKNNLEKFDFLCSLKYVSYGLNLFIFIYFSFILLSKDAALCSLGIGIILLLSMIFYLIINTICLNVNIEYIQHFLNKINIDFERYKCDSIWIFLLNIIGIIFFFYYLSIIVYRFLSKKESNSSIRNSIRNNREQNQNPSENDTEVARYDPNGGGLDSKERIKKQKPSIKEKKETTEIKEKKEIIEPEIIIIEKEKEEEKPNCVICMNEEAKIILCPCGHKCVCGACFNSINSRYPKRCPICRKNFIGKIDQVFSP